MKWSYILVTVIVIAVILGCTKMVSMSKGSRKDPNIAKLERVAYVLNECKAQSNRYPESLETILSLPVAKQFFVYSDGDPLMDSWGHKFVYELKGSNYTLLSLGRDGVRGTGDDILKSSEKE
ncbi:MAG: hypothetical protein A2283_13295 [Lentisphaerae bacterium RIFOXYA12_FULL_48_11]|nr:MAG: hypothetical protein A2283_13295 [Lentisphaerae bacterium RIFOXYA12_FULL_48_11]